MELQKGYEVVRFAEQGNLTRIKMDYMKGILLLHRLQENNRIEKEILYQWVESLVTQLCLFHNSQKNQCYRYLSPESVLVTEDDELYLLDLEAESNAFVMRNMQRREMRQHFMKQELYSKQNRKLDTDLYSLGKTLQFMLSRVKLDIPLTKREEQQFYRFTQKCLGENSRKPYHNLNQIQNDIPKFKKKKNHTKKGRYALLLAVFFIGGIFVLTKVIDMENPMQKMQFESQEDDSQETKYEQILYYYQILADLEDDSEQLENIEIRIKELEKIIEK